MKATQLLFLLVCYCYTHLVMSQATVIESPQSQSVCEGETVEFTCILMFPSGTTPGSPLWVNDDGGDASTLPGRSTSDDLNGRPAPTNVTSVLTITNVNTSNNGTSYSCGIGIGVNSVASNESLLTIFARPPAVTSIEVTEVCTNDFTVSWTAASNEERLSYNVTLSSPSMMNGTVADATMDTSYNFTNLVPNTTYEISVLSRVNMCSGMSNEIMATTLMEGTGTPQMVDNLRENNFTTDTITVLWNATPGDSGPVVDCGPVVNYVVTAVNSPDADDMSNVTVKEEEATISNLDKGTTYTITVVAVNRAGSGPPSTINVTTDKDTTVMFNQSTNIVNENAGQVRLVLFLNESLLNDITVEIIVINGSATEAEDFMPGPYSVPFPAGEMNASFNISIMDDNIPEDNETFVIAINPSLLPTNVMIASPTPGAQTDSPGQANITIVNDDFPPEVVDDGPDNTGPIIGIIIAVIVVIVVIIIIIVISYYIYKKKKDPKDDATMELKSPTSTSEGPKMGKASVQPSKPSNVPHQTATSGEEYVVAAKVFPRQQQQQQPPAQEYAVVDKSKKASASQEITYADLQALPSGNAPSPNQGPSTYTMVA